MTSRDVTFYHRDIREETSQTAGPDEEDKMASRKHDCWVKVAEGELCMKPSVVLHRAPVEGFPMSTALNYYCADHKHLVKTAAKKAVR